LKFAKLATGYEGLVVPRMAREGSPAPILTVGVEPDWLTQYAYVDDWSNIGALTEALRTILIKPDEALGEVELLSKWFKAPVKYIGEEEYHGSD
jgi:hypothetical protein